MPAAANLLEGWAHLRRKELADPLQNVELKGLNAGPANLALDLIAGGHLPAPSVAALPSRPGRSTRGLIPILAGFCG
jgi:hypothetical protein